MDIPVVSVLLGVVLGFAIGLTGAGGGALAIPMMVLFLDVPALNAVATAFLLTMLIKIAGVLQHRSQGTINYQVGLYLLLGSVPATVLGAFGLTAVAIKGGASVNSWLQAVVGTVLVVAAIATLAGPRLIGRGRPAFDSSFKRQPVPLDRRRKAVTALVGAVLGLVTGATSVGGGSLVMIALLALHRITAAEVVGTSIAVSLALMIAGTVVYLSGGLIIPIIAGSMAVGAVPAAILGSRLTLRVADGTLRRILAATIMAGGVALFGKLILG